MTFKKFFASITKSRAENIAKSRFVSLKCRTVSDAKSAEPNWNKYLRLSITAAKDKLRVSRCRMFKTIKN